MDTPELIAQRRADLLTAESEHLVMMRRNTRSRAVRWEMVDEVAVQRALNGDRAVRLSIDDRAAAALLLIERGHSETEAAAILGVTDRTVDRIKARQREAS